MEKSDSNEQQSVAQDAHEDGEAAASRFDAQVKECVGFLFQGFRPPPDFSIAEWADENRILPPESSNEHGPWRTERTPYLREVMDELSPRSHAEDVVFMKGTQIGATETLINMVLYYIAHVPCPILVVEPTIDIAERVSKQRFRPSIAAVSEVARKIAVPKSRATGNTILEKEFPGGVLVIGGANSAASMRSMPIRVAAFDEEDGYPEDADGEGDPVDLGEKRTTNFSRAKRYHISTPTVAGSSRIANRFEESDQRYYYVPCPFCHVKQILKWNNFRFDSSGINAAMDSIHYECESCKAEIHEHHKTWMLANGEWRKHKPESRTPGFHLSALYSPLGWYSWKKVVKDFLRALGNPRRMKVWINTVLGECWEEASAAIDSHWVAKRREVYPAEVPAGCLVLVNGTDVQDDRLESSTIGFGWNYGVESEEITAVSADHAAPLAGVESWLIDHSVFRGDPGGPDVWRMLDQYLLREWHHESGTIMQVAATGVDAMGHFTNEVYKFCGARPFQRIFPMQGRPGSGRPLVSRGTKNPRYRVYLFQVGTYAAKDTLYSRLKIPKAGPGYVHFPKTLTDDKYFEQLTAEKKVMRRHAGMPRAEWILPGGARNEALDCFVYALAALQVLNPNLELLASEQTVFSPSLRGPARPKRRLLSKGVQP